MQRICAFSTSLNRNCTELTQQRLNHRPQTDGGRRNVPSAVIEVGTVGWTVISDSRLSPSTRTRQTDCLQAQTHRTAMGVLTDLLALKIYQAAGLSNGIFIIDVRSHSYDSCRDKRVILSLQIHVCCDKTLMDVCRYTFLSRQNFDVRLSIQSFVATKC